MADVKQYPEWSFFWRYDYIPDVIQDQMERNYERMHGALPPEGFLYRFADAPRASLNPYKYEWGNDDEYDIVLYVRVYMFPVRTKTATGWTIHATNGNGWRFISANTFKRYALPTVMEARADYIKRKERQISLYRARIARTKEYINIVRNKFFSA